MRFFSLLDFQHWILATSLGLILMYAVYIAWRGYPRDRESIDDPDREVSPDFVPESQHNPPAPLLMFIYAGTILWAAGYLVVVGIYGGAIY